MLRPYLASPIGLAVLLLVGCGESDRSGEDEPRTFTIELTENGDHTIAGQVSLPESTPSGHLIQLAVERMDSPHYLSVESPGSTNGEATFAFRIVNASDGEYKVASRVDMDDSGRLDSGDLEGFYDGTVDEPIQDNDLATVITISGASVDGVDFGLGARP